MPHNDDTSLNLKEFESSLAELRPQASCVNRDRLLFEAGRQAERIQIETLHRELT